MQKSPVVFVRTQSNVWMFALVFLFAVTMSTCVSMLVFRYIVAPDLKQDIKFELVTNDIWSGNNMILE